MERDIAVLGYGTVMQITVTRRWSYPDNAEFRATTTGTLSIDGQQTAFTLEPTALMVPSGSYPVKLAWSRRFERLTPHLDVPGRQYIEIHGGNIATDSEGCILVADKRLTEYRIYEAKPATDAIEDALRAAEANGETNTVTVIG